MIIRRNPAGAVYGGGCLSGFGALMALISCILPTIIGCVVPLTLTAISNEQISALATPLVCPAGSQASVYGVDAMISNVSRPGSRPGTAIRVECIDESSGAVTAEPLPALAAWTIGGTLAAAALLSLIIALPLAVLLGMARKIWFSRASG